MAGRSISKIASTMRGLAVPLGVFSHNGRIGMICRTRSLLRPVLALSWSKDGVRFVRDKKTPTLKTDEGATEKLIYCRHFSVVSNAEGYVLTYIREHAPVKAGKVRASSRSPGKVHGSNKFHRTLVVARSKDLYEWKICFEREMRDSHLALLARERPIEGKPGGRAVSRLDHVLWSNGLFAHVSTSTDGSTWSDPQGVAMSSRSDRFDSNPLSLMGAMQTLRGILVFYDCSYHNSTNFVIQVGGLVVSTEDPHHIVWRSEQPLWRALARVPERSLSSLGAIFFDHKVMLYWSTPDAEVLAAEMVTPFSVKESKEPAGAKTREDRVSLRRSEHNPVLAPHHKNEWESQAVFNPAAIYAGGRVHILYRAIGKNNISVLGYASSLDGIHFDERHPDPVYFPREQFEGSTVTGPSSYTHLFMSGGGWGGCEDPKLTAIEDRIYLTYVAFNGWSIPRLAISSIGIDDFLAKRWNWSPPQLMSRPGGEGEIDKSGCLLPEKYKGKFVIFHRVYPDILIDFVDDLDFSGGKWLKNEFKISPRPLMWDSRKISVGAPPIKTKHGWLVIYHAVDDRDASQYKIGAMILSLEDPRVVLYRSSHPILSPDAHYENEGKAGVAYPCGAVVIGDSLYVYYGGGDRVVCVASVPLEEFLQDVMKDVDIPFKTKKIKIK